MVEESDRIIIVTGMMLSGTTILTYLLCQHPDVLCDADDRRHLETRLLRERDEAGIAALLASADKRVLMKIPQRAGVDLLWMHATMPDARFVYGWKTLEAMQTSWARPTAPQIRDTGPAYYDARLAEADALEAKAAHFLRVFHGDLLAQPSETITAVSSWLGLLQFSYDVALVGIETSIKAELGGATVPVGQAIP